MAKQTGQITVLKNNTVTNVEHQIRFIFTKENGERITRDTTSKGVINFDVPNGNWNVSWFAVDGDQKVLPLRAGLQLKITSSTPPTALADWIYGGNTHVADPILTQWTTVLDEMKSVRGEFRDETQQDGTGKFVKQSSVKRNYLEDYGKYYSGSEEVPTLVEGMYGLAMSDKFKLNNAGLDFTGIYYGFLRFEVQKNYVTGNLVVFFNGYNNNHFAIATRRDNGTGWEKPSLFFSPQTTTEGNHGQLYKKTESPVDLLAVGQYGFGGWGVVSQPNSVQLERSGIYAGGGSGSNPFSYMPFLHMSRQSSERALQIGMSTPNSDMQYRTKTINENWTIPVSFLTTKNCVIDSNGNYKPASPVVQLHYNKVEYNEDFDKDNPPEFEHLETGVYRITNVREICKDGWTYNKPLNGKSQPYFMIKYEQEDETTLLVRVFERTFDKNTGEFGFGEPRDIDVDERWIDFHFEVDHERIAREEAQMQKEQEEFEEQERLRKEAEEQEQAEATAAWEAEMARQEAEMIAEMEGAREVVAD